MNTSAVTDNVSAGCLLLHKDLATKEHPVMCGVFCSVLSIINKETIHEIVISLISQIVNFYMESEL